MNEKIQEKEKYEKTEIKAIPLNGIPQGISLSLPNDKFVTSYLQDRSLSRI